MKLPYPSKRKKHEAVRDWMQRILICITNSKEVEPEILLQDLRILSRNDFVNPNFQIMLSHILEGLEEISNHHVSIDEIDDKNLEEWK